MQVDLPSKQISPNGEATLRSFMQNSPMEIEFTQSDLWVNAILAELEESLDEEDRELIQTHKLPLSNASVKLRLTKKSDSQLGHILLVKGDINFEYYSPCSRCLTPTPGSVTVEFNACFLNEHIAGSSDYRDETSVLVDNEEWEIYEQDKGIANLAFAVHEHVFLYLEPFPLHDENCKGLCSKCGTNLNMKECKCSQN